MKHEKPKEELKEDECIVKNGYWVKPIMHGFHMRCCDCGLVHVFDFAVINSDDEIIVNEHRVLFRTYREGIDEDDV